MNRRQFGVLAGSALVVGPAFAAGSVDLERVKLELRLGEVLELFGFYDGEEGVTVRIQLEGASVGERSVHAVLGSRDPSPVSRGGPRPLARDLAPRTWRAIADLGVQARRDGQGALPSDLAGLVAKITVTSGVEHRSIEARLADPAKQG